MVGMNNKANKVKRVPQPERIFQVDAGYACFGIVMSRVTRRVIAVAPIAGWALGRDIDVVLSYFEGKGAVVRACRVAR